MNQPIASVLLVASVALGCLPARGSAMPDENSTNLIVGGFKVSVQDVPYQIALFRDEQFKCGGTIIGPFWALTAQHCVPDTKAFRYTVVVGADIPDDGQRLSVAQVYLPPNNQDNSTFDVALVKLEHELHYSERVGCIALTALATHPMPGTPAYISGYGMTTARGLDSNLKAATVSVLSPDKCNEFYGREVRQYMFCAGFEEGRVDTCQGDSGGPLVVNGELAGVTDWGLGCAREHAPGVYIAVGSFYEWLQKIVQGQRTYSERELCRRRLPLVK